jgi:hypothetical protein
MNTARSIWLTILSPAALLGTTVAIGVYLVEGSLVCPLAVLTACLASAALTATILTRASQSAMAQLRRPELRDSTSSQVGIFSELLDEVGLKMRDLGVAAHDAREDQVATEARTNMRQ